MRLKGRTAIVTGTGSGIGRATALLFANEGAFVALVDRDTAGLQETIAIIRDAKGDGSVHVGDVGDAEFEKRGALDDALGASRIFFTRQLDDETGHSLEVNAGTFELFRHLAAIGEGVGVPGEQNGDSLSGLRETNELIGGVERSDVGIG